MVPCAVWTPPFLHARGEHLLALLSHPGDVELSVAVTGQWKLVAETCNKNTFSKLSWESPWPHD